VRRAVEKSGYVRACTSRYGVCRTTGSSFAIGRTEIAGCDTLSEFRGKLEGRYDWVRCWQAVNGM
jgi:hypothetical protein